jgi:murein DD-endopeptidase MepM/ murein hydrolase activator NlpD
LTSGKRRGWQLLVIPDGESNIRQFRLPRGVVLAAIGLVAALIIYAVIETFMFWSVARKAAEVEPLKQKVQTLENANGELSRMGAELTRLRTFEKQLKRALTGQSGDSLITAPLTSLRSLGDEFGLMPEKTAMGKASEAVQALDGTPQQDAVFSYTAADLPTQPPIRGYVTRNFSQAGPRQSITHHGIDIAAKQGTTILAAADGLVVFSDWTYDYGNMIVLSHRSGFATFYGHNQTLLVKSGERVQQGQPIALLGNSGKSSAPHLHFEVWSDGEPIDPMTLFKSSP